MYGRSGVPVVSLSRHGEDHAVGVPTDSAGSGTLSCYGEVRGRPGGRGPWDVAVAAQWV